VSLRQAFTARRCGPILSRGRTRRTPAQAGASGETESKATHHVSVLPRARALGYEPALDGVRGVAVLAVVGYHADYQPRDGPLGVDIFFVLSGFLITTLLLQEWHANGSISLRLFFARRALRLFPALAVMLAVFVASSVVLSLSGHLSRGQLQQNVKSVALGAFYVSNIARAWFSPDPMVTALGHLWSLATEEQFYLLWPVALAILLRSGARERTVLKILALLAALVAVHRLQLTLAGASDNRLFYAPDTHFDSILVGCLAGACYTTGMLPRVLRTDRGARLARIAATWFVVFVLLLSVPLRVFFVGGFVLFEIAVAVLLISILTTPACALANVLRRPIIVAIGRMSYALYLWHLVLLSALGVRLGLPFSFLAAAASTRFVERPFLRRKKRSAARLRQQADGVVAVPDTSTRADRASLGRASGIRLATVRSLWRMGEIGRPPELVNPQDSPEIHQDRD
jgi:peptidoglycan/LPS O-acetylase OafA/YrhL